MFAIGGTKDYFAWIRARWMALNDLLESGKATAKDVDGGFEFNGWYLYDAAYRPKPSTSWWWVYRDTYVVGFGKIPGYTVVKEYEFSRWLPPCTGRIVLLRRESGNAIP